MDSNRVSSDLMAIYKFVIMHGRDDDFSLMPNHLSNFRITRRPDIIGTS